MLSSTPIKPDPQHAISKIQITFKDTARADEKAQHTLEYVSILPKQQTAKQFIAFTIHDRESKEV